MSGTDTREEIANAIRFGIEAGCSWETTRDGELAPCERPAVAVRRDTVNGGFGPVCKHHAVKQTVDLEALSWSFALLAPPLH